MAMGRAGIGRRIAHKNPDQWQGIDRCRLLSMERLAGERNKGQSIRLDGMNWRRGSRVPGVCIAAVPRAVSSETDRQQAVVASSRPGPGPRSCEPACQSKYAQPWSLVGPGYRNRWAALAARCPMAMPMLPRCPPFQGRREETRGPSPTQADASLAIFISACNPALPQHRRCWERHLNG